MSRHQETLYFQILWICLFVFLPLQIPLLEWKDLLITPLWEYAFGLFTSNPIQLFSDSEGFYLIALTITLISPIFYLILHRFLDRNALKSETILNNTLVAIIFLVFAKYGLDKIQFLQFSPPEPNILFTELRHLDKDLLFWTSMGTSKAYNTISGTIELLGALMLVFKRTRRLGLMILLLSAFYIVLLNLSFNIGVKLFSMLLLGSLITLNWNTITFLFSFFLSFGDAENRSIDKRYLLPGLKIILTFSIILYLVQSNLDEKVENELVNAYASMESGSDKMIFINQQDYWIEKDNSGIFSSYKIYKQSKHSFLLKTLGQKNKHIQFRKTDQETYLLTDENGEKSEYHPVDLNRARALQDDFNFIIR